jgi:hypothetical protein
MSRRAVVSVVAVVLVVGIGVGLALFQPWRLVTTRTTNESLLVSTSVSSSSAAPSSSSVAPPAGPVALASGPSRSLEHATTGSATLVQLPDGGHAVQFEALDTSDGPDLYVYLSDKSSDSAEAAFGSGFTSLGKLKGNQGNQVYAIPAGASLDTVRSVVIWCLRFSAGFAVAPLEHS